MSRIWYRPWLLLLVTVFCNLRISFFLCHLQNYITLHTLVRNNRATIGCLYSEFLIHWTDSNCLVSSAALVSLAYLYINQLFTWLDFRLKWSSSVKVDLQMTQTKATVSSCSPWVWSWSLFNCSMKNSLQSLFGSQQLKFQSRSEGIFYWHGNHR